MQGPGYHLRHTTVMAGTEDDTGGVLGQLARDGDQLNEYVNGIFDGGYSRENGLTGLRLDLGIMFEGSSTDPSAPGSISLSMQHAAIYNPLSIDLIPSSPSSEEISDTTLINPYENGLSYGPWIDEGSFLTTNGETSDQQGAQILTFKGKSGKFYGETGYNTETNIRCWPVPQEREKGAWARNVADYTGVERDGTGRGNYTAGTATLSATRGSTELDQSTTSYILRKLGNATPQFSEIVTVSGVNVSIAWQPLEATIDRDQTVKYLVYRGDSNGANGAVIATLTPTEFNYIDTPGSGTHSYWIVRRDTTRGFSLRPPGYYSLGVVA